ncbi:hypothetical protein ACI2IX_20140 [Leifsonia aquatica]|uniref:hypothetical protein n=1 Tax=Leifsonia aquatica TaxID=144185 RepID=UPI00384FBF64
MSTTSNIPDHAASDDVDQVLDATETPPEAALSATTESEPPASSAQTGRPGFFRRHWISTTAIATVCAVILGVGAYFVVQNVQQEQHDTALAARQAAVATVTKLRKEDTDGRKTFGTAHDQAAALQGEVTKLHTDAAAGAFLNPEQIAGLEAEAAALDKAAKLEAGDAVAALPTLGAPAASTDRLNADTRALQKLTKAAKTGHDTTVKAAANITTQLKHTNTVLTSFITGAAATDSTAEIPALNTNADGVNAALASAGDPEKVELVNAANAAIDGVNAGQAPAPLLQAYLDKSAAVKDSHDQAELVKAAQNAGADTYVDTNGQTVRTPAKNSNGSGGNGTGSGTNNNGDGGAHGDGGAASPGGGAGSGVGGGVDTSLHINVGTHVGSCPADRPVAYDFSQSVSYGSWLTVPNFWLSYTTTNTGSGWRVDGLYCDTY